MASIADQKQEARDIIASHMKALADVAVEQGDLPGIHGMMMQMLTALTSRMTLAELKEWQEHVESKYGHLVSND